MAGMKTPASKLIGQFNKRGVISTPIQYADVADVMMQHNEGKIAKILAELEAKGDTVRDPTAWVKIAAKNAAKKAGKAGPSMSAAYGMPMMGMLGMPQKSSASKLIGQFNKRGVTTPIQYADVSDAMMQLSDGKISKILSELEEKKDAVRDPTAWVKTAAMKAGSKMPAAASMPLMAMRAMSTMPMMGMPQKSSASKLIGQFNKRGVTAPIKYDDVAEVMNQLSENKIAKILSELEERADTVRDPTAWVKIAAVKAPKAGPAAAMSMMSMMGMPQMGMPQMGIPQMGMPQKPAASKLIGQFNKRGVTVPIQYKDVAQVMMQLSEGKIAKILSELEEKKDTVRDPTAWVKVAAGKAVSSMSMGGRPAKRMRLA